MKGDILTLASNATTSDGAAVQWEGGKGAFVAEATWGGGSATLQFKTKNGTWVAVDGIALTANGHKIFELPRGEIRVVIATSTAVYSYAHVM